jgi:hypothetical protein
MAAKVSQLPAQLDAECVAGDPFSLSVTSSGATITSPTVTLKSATGATITGTVPTVSQVGAVTTVAFSAATTAALNTDLTRPVSLLWSLSALVNGAGPFQLVARRLTIQPVGTAGVSSTSSATLAVTVGGAAVSLAVALGGTGLQAANNLSDLASAATARTNLGAEARYTNSMSFTNGQMTWTRQGNDSGGTIPTSGRLNLMYFVADKSFTATKVRSVNRGTACSALTRCRFGVWEIDGSGNGTLVASTPNDTSLFTGTFTAYTKDFSASVDIVGGRTYAAGWLITGTIGTFYGGNPNAALGNLPPRTVGDITTADLPASFTDASVNLNTAQYIFAGIFTAGG